MMKHTAALFLICTLASTSASASGLPQVDTANLKKQILEHVQEARFNDKLLKIMKENLAQAFNLQALGVDADNNGMANSIVRRAKAMQDIQNLKTLEQSAPDPDACETIAAGYLIEVAEKGEASIATRRSTARSELRARAAASASSPAPSALEMHADKVAILKRQETRAAQSDLATVGPGVLFGSGVSADGDRRQAAEDFVDTIAPVFVPSGADKLSMESQKQRFVEGTLRYGAMKNTPEASLSAIAGLSSSQGQGVPSTQFVLAQQADAIYLSPHSFMNKVARGDLSISQMMRRAAAAKALQLHMDLLAYRQALRQEVLLSVKLAQQLPSGN